MEINEPFDCPLCGKHVTSTPGEKVVQVLCAGTATGLKTIATCGDCASIERTHVGRVIEI